VDLSKKELDQLVRENIGLVRYVARKYRGISYYEDLLQEGAIGLIEAARKYDPTKGHAFSSMAVPYIRGHILHYFRSKSEIIRVPYGQERIPTYSLHNEANAIANISAPIVETDENLEDLLNYIQTLSDNKRKLFEMRLAGDQQKQMMAEFGVAQITISRRVKKLVDQARITLGAKLPTAQPK
jgi:RNA polymerase sigma factor (sigma-70 family)